VKLSQLETIKIRVDNKSVIELAKNPVHHERSKHIDVKFHSIQEQIKNEKVRVVICKAMIKLQTFSLRHYRSICSKTASR
jgi:hypothetical protein